VRLRLRAAGAAAAVGALAFAVYLPSRDARLVGLDDHVMVERDQALHRDPAALVRAFASSFYDTYYRPLHRISLVLDARLSGDDPRGYHRTNAALHALACAAVLGALLALGYGLATASALAALWAVHPALVSAVAWIPGRDNVLMTLFLLGSLVGWSRYLEARGRAAAAGFLAIHWLLLLAAFLTKEAALAFPAAAAAFAWLWREGDLPWRRLAAGAAGWLAAFALFLALRARVLPLEGDWQALGLDALAASWPTPLAALGKLALPVRLSAFASLDALAVATGVAAAAAAAVVSLRSPRVRAGRVLFGAAWLLLLIAPTLVQRTGLYDYGEYRLYWLGVGPLLALAELLRALPPMRRAAAVLAAGVCALFAAQTLAYQRVFDGPERFWGHLVELDPGSGWGWFHVGRHLYAEGRLEDALQAYRRAQELHFERADLYVDLSAARLALGDAEGASAAAARALELEPGHPHALANLGDAELRLGDFEAAIEALGAALDPRAEEHFRYAAPVERHAFRAHVTLRRIRAHLGAGDREGARRLAAELERLGEPLPPALARRIQRGAPPSE